MVAAEIQASRVARSRARCNLASARFGYIGSGSNVG